ncbi:MAG: exosome complex RNA-binding protein Rrp4 [Candidatus Hadarchaeaceae archaeon]|nr:exosome complex RNA-binding protein Rrp4 [Hadesarchaea archaeon]MDH5685508.1 exosome complex RNA-binding protein Rrp4 [Hadesarchaea archaeon]
MLHVQNRELVVPGQLIAEGDYRVYEGAFREDKQIYASVVGLADVRGQNIRIIPLQGGYIPKQGDVVIGVVVDSHYSGWILDINSPYTGNLFVSDLLRRKVDLVREDISQYLSMRDVVIAGVKDVNERMRVQLEAGEPGMGRVEGGKLVEISPMKIPRVIGRKGSMLKTLQNVGQCRIEVGQNGRIMIWGKNPRMTNAIIEAVLMIEREAHTSGLTDRVHLMLEKIKSEGGE